MTVFCTLHIRSDENARLPEGFVLSRNKTKIEFVDQAAPDVCERRMRVRRQLGLEDVALPRYHWRLSTERFVNSDEIHQHLLWILDQIMSDIPMSESLGDKFDYWFSVFWQGNGTGGGPMITLKTTDLLARHRAEMGVAFYAEP